MITADTLTNEQIRGLWDVLRGTKANARMLTIAIQGPTQSELDRGHTKRKARARCAEILNARIKERNQE